jgi:hypothetical protein
VASGNIWARRIEKSPRPKPGNIRIGQVCCNLMIEIILKQKIYPRGYDTKYTTILLSVQFRAGQDLDSPISRMLLMLPRPPSSLASFSNKAREAE